MQGTLSSTPNSTFTIQFFGNAACDASLNGEGQTFLGAVSVTTGGTGAATIPLFIASAAQIVTATATSSTNDTSEFSACVTVPAGPATFAVTTTNNAGAGSFRQAILDSNASPARDTIVFNIAGSGLHTIAPTSPLPTITDSVTIDGRTQPGFAGTPLVELDGTAAGPTTNGLWLTAAGSVIQGLVINRFGTGGTPRSAGGAGIVIQGANNVIEGNFIGTDATGTGALGNREDGLWIDRPGNRVGGSTAAARNVISGNGRYGILLSGTTPTSTVIEGNRIGTDVSGSASVGNAADGIHVMSAGNTIGGLAAGAGNTVAANAVNGISVNGASASGNRILGNSVFDNGALGIDLGANGLTENDPADPDTGANNFQNFPVLTGASGGVEGILNSRPNTTYRIEYFGSASCDPSGHGEGQVLLGAQTVTTDPEGSATLPFIFGGSGMFVTATATHSVTNDTSEFSECVQPTASFRTWISSTGGNWEDPTKWSGGVVPQPGEIAIIGVNGTVVVSTATVALEQIFTTAHVAMSGGALSVSSSASFAGGLTLTGGVLDGPGLIFLQGTSTWTGGVFRGANDLHNQGTLTVSMPSADLRLERRIVNQGTMRWNTAAVTLNGRNLHNFFGGVLEFQSNLTVREIGAGGGRLINHGILTKSGPIGVLTIDGDQGTVFTTSGLIRLRLGPQNDRILSNRTVELDGGLELVLEPGFDPEQGALFNVFEWFERSGEFLEIFGVARRYPATYTSTELILSSERSLALPMAFGGFSGGERIETFTQNFGQQASPVTFNGITYSSPGIYLDTSGNWDGFYPAFPSASAGAGLNDLVSRSQLQLDFSTPVRRVGLLATTASQTAFVMKAYDNDLREIGTASAVMPGFAEGTFLGLQAPVNIRRILITEAFDNGQISVIDDIRYEDLANQRPIASAGPDQSVNADTTVQLNGERSSDPENQSLTYRWTVVSRPSGSNATLVGQTSVTPTFVADRPGSYVIRLVVNDGIDDSESDDVEIQANGPPAADAGPDQTVPVGSTAQLDGIGSTDPEGSTLSYHWVLNTRPSTSTDAATVVVVVGAEAPAPEPDFELLAGAVEPAAGVARRADRRSAPWRIFRNSWNCGRASSFCISRARPSQ